MSNVSIFRIIGGILISFGGISAFALLVLAIRSAIKGQESIARGPGMGTLWGLFIICLGAGILILIFAR